jgi:hypothetical protein
MSLLEEILGVHEEVKNETNLDTILHHYRTQLEPIVFDRLRANYLEFFRSWWSIVTLPDAKTSKHAIVLYETRKHPNLEFLIYNVCYFSPSWGLIIYCSDENYDMICDILGRHRPFVDLRFLSKDHCSLDTKKDRLAYNDVLRSRSFWSSLSQYSHVLMAEVDSYMIRQLPDYATDVDYCASVWAWKPETPGGGGISVRRVAAMLDICDVEDNDVWAQDVWASEGIETLGYTWNNRLFTESCLHENPVGVHQWWTFLSPLDDKKLEFFESYMRLDIS